MDILVIGGNQFVGKHFVRAAARGGHEVTLFNRGNKPAPEGAADVITGDRNSDLGELAGREWDAVLDTCAYFPRQVTEAVAALEESVGHYTLISSISVYAEQTRRGLDEDAAVLELEDPAAEEVTNENYGGLKVRCERELERRFEGPKLVARPGLIVGPDDPTDRFTYWPVRLAEGGEVLGPVGPDMPVQWIDVRDVADWLVRSVEAGLTGTYNLVSEAGRFAMSDVVEAAAAASGTDAAVTWVDEEFLLEQGVGPWMEMPLWMPGEQRNFSFVDGSRAKATGLSVRPAEDTVAATLAWHRQAEERPWRAGLEREREAEVLAAWNAREGAVSERGG